MQAFCITHDIPPEISSKARYASNLSPIQAVLTSIMAAPPYPTAGQQEQSAADFSNGGGGIGGLQRKSLKNHKRSRFVGFCDVDQLMLDKVGKDYPDAWNCHDYREAFARRIHLAPLSWHSRFPHAPMMLTAMAHGKHMYGQTLGASVGRTSMT